MGGNKAKPRKREREEVDPKKLLEEKLALTMEVTGSELITKRKNRVDNLPVVIITTWQITQCKGCRKGIIKEEKQYPHSLVIHHCVIIGYCNQSTQKLVNEEANIHFHLNMKCLCKSSPFLEKRHFICNNEEFCKLDHA